MANSSAGCHLLVERTLADEHQNYRTENRILANKHRNYRAEDRILADKHRNYTAEDRILANKHRNYTAEDRILADGNNSRTGDRTQNRRTEEQRKRFCLLRTEISKAHILLTQSVEQA